MNSRSIQFGSRKIEYSLGYSDRKTLGITVTPDLDVLVTAPIGAKENTIEEKLLKRAPWIIKQQSHFLAYHPKTPPRKYIDGETHLYLGRQYRLRLIEGVKESVKLKGKFLIVTTLKNRNVKLLVKNWYLNHAKIRFNEIANKQIQKFSKYEVKPSKLEIREMSLRWGSCTPNGKIILNPELIKSPKACIEYVIVHELCHLVYRDHSKKFFELQTKEMPDWKKWKGKLEKLLA